MSNQPTIHLEMHTTDSIRSGLPASSQKSSLQSPKPSHFLVRPTGEIVPVVAVDEFPPGTNLVGVPRTIGIEATAGMLNLGLIKKMEGSSYYALKDDACRAGPFSKEATAIKAADPHPIEQNAKKGNQTLTLESGGRMETRDSSDENEEHEKGRNVPSVPNNTANTSLSSSIYNTSSSSSNNNGTSPHAETQLPQTTFCRHWCHHGNCKWGQQCRYKHIMPMSISGLAEVGLRDWPSWYRSLNPGYFVDSCVGLARPQPRTPGTKNPRRVNGGRRGAIGDGLGDEIIHRLRAMEVERQAEREKNERIRRDLAAEREKEVRRRVLEERRAREEASAKGVAVQRDVEKGARRWADEDSEDESVVEKEVLVTKVVGNLVEL